MITYATPVSLEVQPGRFMDVEVRLDESSGALAIWVGDQSRSFDACPASILPRLLAGFTSTALSFVEDPTGLTISDVDGTVCVVAQQESQRGGGNDPHEIADRAALDRVVGRIRGGEIGLLVELLDRLATRPDATAPCAMLANLNPPQEQVGAEALATAYRLLTEIAPVIATYVADVKTALASVGPHQ